MTTGPGPHSGALAFLLVSLWAAIANVFTHYYVPSAYNLSVIIDFDFRRREA